MSKCKKKGYHDWEVIGVGGTLPNQEIELCCKDCDLEHTAYEEVQE
jgi:hypothetical protein